jgi:hypothetical protein
MVLDRIKLAEEGLVMKKILIMLAALPLLAAGLGSGHFSGRVFNVEGTTQIPDAIVTVSTPSGFVSSVTTNKHGEFNFSALPAGEYDFRVTAHGFAIYERQVTVSSDAQAGMRELDIRMLVPSNRQVVSVADLMKRDATRASLNGF